MSDFLSQLFLMNTLREWLITLFYIIGGIIVAKAFYFIFKKISSRLVKKSKIVIDDILVDTLEKPVILAVAVIGFYLGTKQLNKTDAVDLLLNNSIKVLIAICVTWFVARLVNAMLEQYLLPAIETSESASRKQLIPIVTKLLTVAIWIIGIIIGFNAIGYNLAGLIAGLGIGGLAFALAAKDYLQNIFGGVSVFTDKPFTINQRIKIDGFDGIVEQIGIRNSRIRTVNGSLVTIPNSKFISNSIENIDLELHRKIVLKLGLTYHATSNEIEEAMRILHSIVDDNQDILTENKTTFFESFGDFSLNIVFVYYIKKGQDIASSQSKVNLEILKRFEQANLEFAFPTQTIYTINQ